MATLTDMKSFISSRLKDENNVRVSAVDVASAVNQAIRFWKRKKFWFNEFEDTITISSAGHTLTFTNETPLFLYTIGGIVIDQSDMRWPLRKVSTQYYDRVNREGTGRPYCWTYRNQGYEVYFYADQDYTAICRGIKDYSDLDTTGNNDDAQTNDFTVNTPDLIQYEALARIHGEILQDPDMAKFFSDEAQKEYDSLGEFMDDKYGTGENEISSLLI